MVNMFINKTMEAKMVSRHLHKPFVLIITSCSTILICCIVVLQLFIPSVLDELSLVTIIGIYQPES